MAQAARGLSLLLLEPTVQTLLRLPVIAILARYLTRTEFGIVAVALIVVSILELEEALGIAPALIQRKDLELRHVETGQVLSLRFAPAPAVGISRASVPLSEVLSSPQSAGAMRVLCVVVLLRTAVSASEALLYRKMQFREIAGARVASYFIGYVVIGVGLVMAGFGYWSLVYAEVAQFAIRKRHPCVAKRTAGAPQMGPQGRLRPSGVRNEHQHR